MREFISVPFNESSTSNIFPESGNFPGVRLCVRIWCTGNRKKRAFVLETCRCYIKRLRKLQNQTIGKLILF